MQTVAPAFSPSDALSTPPADQHRLALQLAASYATGPDSAHGAPFVAPQSSLISAVLFNSPPEGPRADTHAITVVHVYEPVLDADNEVVDFRLTFNHEAARETNRSFDGIKVVQCGPSVAPGEIFHTLKRVFVSGECLQTVTRHATAERELCFRQAAARVGDTVVTTTSIST